MTLYTVENTKRMSNPVRIFDAHGIEWTRVIEADSETGRILRYATNFDGKKFGGERAVVYALAPLQVIPRRLVNPERAVS